MSSELDSMYISLQNNQVPANWVAVAYPSLKPLGSWFKDLIERVKVIEDWLVNGQPNAFWLSGFFFPQGFMTGCLQTHARLHKIAIDQLNFSYKVMEEEEAEEIEEGPEVNERIIDNLGWSLYIRTLHGWFKVGQRAPTCC